MVRFRPGFEAAQRLLTQAGISTTTLEGRGTLVTEPAGWSQRELESFIVRRIGPYLISMSSVQTGGPVGGCNCMGRRN